jgi:hypothetical protein
MTTKTDNTKDIIYLESLGACRPNCWGCLLAPEAIKDKRGLGFIEGLCLKVENDSYRLQITASGMSTGARSGMGLCTSCRVWWTGMGTIRKPRDSWTVETTEQDGQKSPWNVLGAINLFKKPQQ